LQVVEEVEVEPLVQVVVEQVEQEIFQIYQRVLEI
tara:strand:- start:458 stop:562 length:105 start_codon:yes stop_codon:yes gene_type:complete